MELESLVSAIAYLTNEASSKEKKEDRISLLLMESRGRINGIWADFQDSK